jgi:membrane protein YqaA with SNARE-associated domain
MTKHWRKPIDTKDANDTQPFLRLNFFLPLVAILVAVFFLIDFFSKNPELFEQFIMTYGLPGLFVATIIANATILLPVPIDILVVLFGQTNFYDYGILSPLVLGLVVGLGASIGELSGYLMGYFSIKTLGDFKKKHFYPNMEDIKDRLERQGIYFIALGALIPFPFDIIGLLCGVLKFDIRKFFIAVWVGKTTRYVLLAYAGFYSIGFLRSFFGV